jgi:signal transduction histidine kinase
VIDRRSLLGRLGLLAGAGLLLSPGSTCAQVRGTPEQAQAMVAKAIALFTDKGEAAFPIMQRGAATGFLKDDLYIFVFSTGPAARVVVQAADQKRVGLAVATLVDSDGKAFGKEMEDRATAEGTWVDYKRTNPATNKEEPKSSWVVLYGGYVFGCGIYKVN